MSSLKQLSGQDATFLYLDTDRASSGGTMIYVYDQSTVPAGKLRFKQILKHIESRIDTSPVFRRKLKQVPLALDYPYWVTDDNFNIENHVSHVALPKPGDWRQFCILASRLTRPHFDMSRPLWEMYVVEGLDNVDWLPKGSFAILTRLHHAAVDGTAVAELTWGLHDLSVDGGKVPHLEVPDVREPSDLEMAARAWWNAVSSPLRLAQPLSNVLPVLGKGVMKMARNRMLHPMAEPSKQASIPKTRFNQRVSPNRVFTSSRFSLDEFKRIRGLVPGSTINDVVVAVIGGALRRYLEAHGELPEDPMVAAMPVNTRDPNAVATAAENQITFMAAAIGSQLEDAVERLQFVYANTSNSKTVLQGMGAKDLTDINRHVPAALLAAAAKMISTVGFDSAGTGKRLFNVAVSNVPGPTVPIYLKGAQLRFWSVVGPLADGMGSIFAVTSYNGELFICPTACRDIVPDPEFLSECIEASFGEYTALR